MPATLFLPPNTLRLSSSQPNSPPFSYFPISSSLNPNPNPNPNPPKPKFLFNLTKTPESDAAIKAPTAPWMTAPLLLQPHEVPHNLPKPKKKRSSSNGDGNDNDKADRALNDKVGGVRGPKAMQKIVRSIEKLQKSHDDAQRNSGEFEFGDFFERIGSEELPEETPWSRDGKIEIGRPKKGRVATAAESSLDRELLRRLRGEAAGMRKWVKVMKAGVIPAVVDEIRRTWKKNELAMVKFDLPLSRNMDRALEILEMKTGGLVVWTKKDVHVIYRGTNYRFASKTSPTIHEGISGSHETPTSMPNQLGLENKNTFTREDNIKPCENRENVPAGFFLEESSSSQQIHGSLYERETDRLLDGLGPRYMDWWMRKPLPVDADLLPEKVPGFRLPYRLCPPGAKAKLTDEELTYLRKFARLLPTHFVLGRNRKLQGLAAAILKLWHRSIIVKIAVKWGVQNTSNEQMANELKDLTGGVLLLRNKFYIIIYRGKDFVHDEVANLIFEREMELKRCLLDEEGARLNSIEVVHVDGEPLANSSIVGTLSEFQDIETEFRDLNKGNSEAELQLVAEKERLERELKQQERKLFILNSKIERASKQLSKLNAAWAPAGQDEDQEMMTEEERECFQKIGKKMQTCLVLGRRGVFDGVMEGLHQHWKHREVVKVITMQRSFRQVIFTAKFLAAESGGVLVSLEKLKDGHAIILYRGKNYRRPSKLAHRNLLTKREALRRSLEMQRLGVFCISETTNNLRFDIPTGKCAEKIKGYETEFVKTDDIASVQVNCETLGGRRDIDSFEEDEEEPLPVCD